MSLTSDLAALALMPLTPAESERIKSLTLSNVAAGLGDLGTARSLVRDIPTGTGVATVVHRLAMQIHARTQDDFYPLGKSHIGAICLAIAVALSEEVGDRLLECLIAGYRVSCAVSAAFGGEAQRRGLRPTSLFGPLAGAATAAVAYQLDTAQVANAIGLASALAGGTNQAWISGTDEWLIEVGHAARLGADAASYTRSGAIASDLAVEGEAGWARAMFGDKDGLRLVDVLRDGAPGVADVAAKAYPVSGIAQVPTYLACAAHAQLPGSFDEAIIVISANDLAYPGSANRGPFHSRSDSLMSVAFCVAAGLCDGKVKIGRLDEPRSLQQFVDRVEVQPAKDLGGNNCQLHVSAGDRRIELAGGGDDVLYPSWEHMSMSTTELAERCEADAQRVTEASAILQRERPSAAALATLLEIAP